MGFYDQKWGFENYGMSHCVLQEPRALGATRTRMGSSVLWIQLFVAGELDLFDETSVY